MPSLVFAHDPVNLYGRNFPFASPQGLSVTFGGTPVAILSVAPNVITFEAPAGSGEGRVSVTLPGKPPQDLGTLRILGNDQDGDRLPDEVEPALSLDPARIDTDQNGVPDGIEDFDHDGVPNYVETLRGTDPRNPDTDGDGLSDGSELSVGSDALKADSDGDGWLDAIETDAGSSPVNPNSRPRLMVVAGPPLVTLTAPGSLGPDAQSNVTAAQPPVISVTLPVGAEPDSPPNVTVARPPIISVTLPRNTGVEALPLNVTLARPPVSVSPPPP